MWRLIGDVSQVSSRRNGTGRPEGGYQTCIEWETLKPFKEESSLAINLLLIFMTTYHLPVTQPLPLTPLPTI